MREVAVLLSVALFLQAFSNVPAILARLTNEATFNRNDLLPADLRDRLTNFTSSGIDSINFTAYQDQFNQALLSADLGQQIMQLENFSATINNTMAPTPNPVRSCTDDYAIGC